MKKNRSLIPAVLVLLLILSLAAGCDKEPDVTSYAGSSAVSSLAQVSEEASSENLNTVLFAEDFESGMDRWTTAEGNWTVTDDDSKVLAQSDRDAWEAIATAGEPGWTDYSVSARVKIHNGYAGLLGRVDTEGNMYLFDVNELGFCVWRKYQEGWSQLTADNEYPVSIDEWHTLKMTFEGSAIKVYIDDVQVGDTVSDNLIGSGKIGLRSSYGTFSADDIVVE